MFPTDDADKGYSQITYTIPAGALKVIRVIFSPDTWYLVPLTALPDPVLVSTSPDIDVTSNGIPIQGSNPSTLPAVRGSKNLYLLNTGTSDVIFSVTASRGYAPAVTSTPTVISSTGVTGVWQTLTDGATISWALNLGNADVTLDGNRVMANPSNVVAGEQYFLLIKQDAVTGGRSLTWGSDFHFAGGSPPVLSYLPDEWDLLEFFADDNGYLHLQRITNNMRNEFTPLSLGNLWSWCKADSMIGLVDGDPIGNWEDQSGGGHDFVQVNNSYKPKWRQSVINNKPALQFDGINDRLENFQNFETPFMVYAVYFVSSVAATHFPISIDFMSNLYLAAGTGYTYYSNSLTIAGGATIVDTPKLYTIEQKANYAEYWENGNSQGSNTSAAGASSNQNVMGARFETYIYPFHGYLAEVLIFTIDHTPAQRTQVQEYLRGKYNLW